LIFIFLFNSIQLIQLQVVIVALITFSSHLLSGL